jgi:hypothetical protein
MHHMRSSFLKLAFMASMLLWASIAVTPAMAAQVTFKFDGPVLAGTPSLLSALSLPPNPTLKGFFTYDSSTVSGADNTTSSGVIKTVMLNLGNGTYNTGTLSPQMSHVPNSIKIEDTLQSDRDQYTVTIPLSNGPPVGSGSGTFLPDNLEIKFINAPGVFSHNNVPGLGSIIGAPTFSLTFLNFGGSSEVTGTTPLVATPLPPAVILFGAGLVALFGLGTRNWWLKGNGFA